MRQLANGDAQAMERLLHFHGESLARLVGRLTAWHVDQDDILQDVLVQVWTKAGSFRADGSLEGWLKRIAVNRCRNHFRSLASWKRKLERLTMLTTTHHYEDPLVEFDGVDDALKNALTCLSQEERTTVVLYYLEQMPGAEVAQTMGIKTETLHVRLHRARKKLKQVLQQDSFDD